VTSGQWEEVKRLFHEALDRPVDGHAAWIAQQCRGDPEVGAEVERLITAHLEAGSFIDTPAADLHPERQIVMALAAGARLGPYEIVAPIGAGGMGEVYRGRDTRLDRSVAIKVLPDHLSSDPNRRARFEREARNIAGLTHPNICTLHDVGEHAGAMFLIMEHLDGETLAERIAKGPLPIERALTIATEIAAALSAAHRHGIIHRDLKPANVMLTKGGAKLLDFGLAKLRDRDEQGPFAPLMSARTRSAPLTGEGMIVGTLPYMAPEQLEGKPTDARTDLWALGAIAYEMVSGQRAFEATGAASIMGAILEREPPPLATVKPLTPPGLDRLVRRCLAKSPDDRPDTAHDLANDLRWMQEQSGVGAVAAGLPASFRRRRILRSAAQVLATTVVVAPLALWLWVWSGPVASPAAVVRTSLAVLPAGELNAGGLPSRYISTPGGSRRALTWTPDGRSLVFVGRRDGVQQLYVRALEAAEARPLAGTEGAQVPAVSADGQWVAFWAANALKKVPLAGGPVMEMATGIGQLPMGLIWDGRGRLFFERGGIWQVPTQGDPMRVTARGDAEVAHIPSSILPGDRILLYTARTGNVVIALDLDNGRSTELLHDAADARYVQTGHLVFVRRGVLWAAPFDAVRLKLTGPLMPVLEGVVQALGEGNIDNNSRAGQYAIAATGSLAWIPAEVARPRDGVLVTVDRQGGRISAPLSPARMFGRLRLSPDGRRLAVRIVGPSDQERGLYVFDLARRVLTSLYLTERQEGSGGQPVWSPDGQHIAFGWRIEGRTSLAWVPADGSTRPEALADGPVAPSSWVSDGYLLGVASGDLAVATFEKRPGRVKPLLRTAGVAEQWPDLSRDGRWLAYGQTAPARSQSTTWTASGGQDVYVQPYPGPGARTLVAEASGNPAWHPSGRELFYVRPIAQDKSHMMAVDFEPGPSPRIGAPRLLFEFDPRELVFECTPLRCYDVAHDGQRFYVFQSRGDPPPPVVTHVNIVQNWFEELKARVLVKR
jgi:Tol biopolymer transport system component